MRSCARCWPRRTWSAQWDDRWKPCVLVMVIGKRCAATLDSPSFSGRKCLSRRVPGPDAVHEVPRKLVLRVDGHRLECETRRALEVADLEQTHRQPVEDLILRNVRVVSVG